MKKIIITILSCSILIFNQTTYAANHVGKGFSWYEKKPKKQKKKPAPQEEKMVRSVTQAPPQKKEKTPMERLKEYQDNIQNLRAEMVLNATQENVYKYMVAQMDVFDKSDKVVDFWKQNLLLYPELNSEARHPTEQNAIHAYDKNKSETQNASVRAYQQQGYGLFYVYSENDIYGAEYASQVQLFADTFKMPLLGISMDGSRVPGIRKNKDNNGRLDIPLTPALLLVNTNNSGDIRVVAWGVTTNADIKRNINFIHNGYKSE